MVEWLNHATQDSDYFSLLSLLSIASIFQSSCLQDDCCFSGIASVFQPEREEKRKSEHQLTTVYVSWPELGHMATSGCKGVLKS